MDHFFFFLILFLDLSHELSALFAAYKSAPGSGRQEAPTSVEGQVEEKVEAALKDGNHPMLMVRR